MQNIPTNTTRREKEEAKNHMLYPVNSERPEDKTQCHISSVRRLEHDSWLLSCNISSAEGDNALEL